MAHGRAGLRPQPGPRAQGASFHHPAQPARIPEYRVQAVRLPPVRPPGPDQHRCRPRRRRRRPARQGNRRRHSACHRRQRAQVLPRPVHGRHDRRRGGLPQRLDHRRDPHSAHRLPQLRQPGEGGGLLPARRVRQGHGRRQRGVRRARHQRQREPLQRVARTRHLPDSHNRRARPARRRIRPRDHGLQERGRCRRPARLRRGARRRRLPCRKRVPRNRPRQGSRPPIHRPGPSKPPSSKSAARPSPRT